VKKKIIISFVAQIQIHKSWLKRKS
jgi:hypothetical protein